MSTGQLAQGVLLSAVHVSNPAVLDRASQVPLHQQLSRVLAEQIAEGRYRPGTAIPPERQLCSLYGVSITTVRQAVLDLAEKGMVERAVGRGTFVLASRPRGMRIGLLSTHDLLISQESMSPIVAAMQVATGVAGSSLLHIHQEDPGPMALFLDDVLRRREADALILFTHQPVHAEDIRELASSGVPYVVFNRYLDERELNCLVIDDREATE